MTQLVRERDPAILITRLERAGRFRSATLEQGLSRLTNDDLTVVFEDREEKALGRLLEEVALIQRYGSNVQVRNAHETMLVAAKGLTRLRFDRARNTVVRLFPLHGTTEVEVNGARHVLDFGQDQLRLESASYGGEIELEAELPVLVLVENQCPEGQ